MAKNQTIRKSGIRQSLAERFWGMVEVRNLDDCWLWTKYCDAKGYGRFRIGDSMQRSHRVSWTLCNGPILDGLHVLHQCDTPACVNPNHLYLGTNDDNTRDRCTRGRHRRGERVLHAKLTEEAVRHIRRKELRVSQYARLYGTSQPTITNIQLGNKWKHVQ